MKRIYTQAAAVVVWLGPSETEAEHAIDAISCTTSSIKTASMGDNTIVLPRLAVLA
jgi:hypothetical protein